MPFLTIDAILGSPSVVLARSPAQYGKLSKTAGLHRQLRDSPFHCTLSLAPNSLKDNCFKQRRGSAGSASTALFSDSWRHKFMRVYDSMNAASSLAGQVSPRKAEIQPSISPRSLSASAGASFSLQCYIYIPQSLHLLCSRFLVQG